MTQIVPFAAWKPVPSHSGPMSAHLGLVLHVQVGNNSPYGQFSNPANQASSHWWVSKTGTLEQYVDADLTAWAQAAGNSTWNSVETEGYPSEPLTQAQIIKLAQLYEWGQKTYGWSAVLSESPSAPGFGWHGMGGVGWGNHPGCPGDIRKAQRGDVLALISSPPQPLPQPPPPTHYPGDNVIATPINVPVGADGNGWVPSPVPASKVVNVTINDTNPEAVGAYTNIPSFTGVAAETSPHAPNGALVFKGPAGNFGAVVWSVG